MEARTALDHQAYLMLRTQISSVRACHIGYHILTVLPTVAKQSQENLRNALAESIALREAQLAFLHSNLTNLEWCRSVDVHASALVGREQNTVLLTELYSEALVVVSRIAATQDKSAPRISLAACTFQDPWLVHLDSGMDQEFKKIEALAVKHQAQLSCLSTQEVLSGLLIDELEQKKAVLTDVMGDPGVVEIIDNILNTTENYADPLMNLELKKKMLFMLRKSAKWQPLDRESVGVAGHALIAGTEGRCPDGQASFFEDWMLSFVLSKVDSSKLSMSVGPLQISVALFMLDRKRCFISRHSSRFLFGQRIGQHDASEERTASSVLLTQMMRLPLSLPGSFSTVLYPGFVFRTIKNPDTSLRVQSVMKRYLNGGKIHHVDQVTVAGADGTEFPQGEENITITTRFAGLTLQTIGKELRQAMVHDRALASTKRQPGLVPEPRMQFVIKEEIVVAFVEHDVVLSPAWTRFKTSGFTVSNQFFDSEAAMKEGGNAMRNVMRDAAILRMLEVSGYAIVPGDFYSTLKADWTFQDEND
eukprot:c10024_g1_i1.p1 GENE.c10024_g1_i1~~c10024_g1_i1.p1  ORF type:complete len:533 (-),score=89.28 c10024_g1_i1:17-1615(-)